jgi:hypothetical protein
VSSASCRGHGWHRRSYFLLLCRRGEGKEPALTSVWSAATFDGTSTATSSSVPSCCTNSSARLCTPAALALLLGAESRACRPARPQRARPGSAPSPCVARRGTAAFPTCPWMPGLATGPRPGPRRPEREPCEATAILPSECTLLHCPTAACKPRLRECIGSACFVTAELAGSCVEDWHERAKARATPCSARDTGSFRSQALHPHPESSALPRSTSSSASSFHAAPSSPQRGA